MAWNRRSTGVASDVSRAWLNEDVIVEGWLLARLWAGIRLRVVEQDRGGKTEGAEYDNEGPPMWEADQRKEWRARDNGK